jgi:hypothetical protein
MTYLRLTLASIGGFVAYMAFGGAIFAIIPSLKDEFAKYPAVYRSQAGQLSHMPVGMVGMFLSVIALTLIYARTSRDGSGLIEGAIFGVLTGVFAIGSFVLHNYVNMNIGIEITLQSSIVYLVQWTLVGAVIGMVCGLPQLH